MGSNGNDSVFFCIRLRGAEERRVWFFDNYCHERGGGSDKNCHCRLSSGDWRFIEGNKWVLITRDSGIDELIMLMRARYKQQQQYQAVHQTSYLES